MTPPEKLGDPADKAAGVDTFRDHRSGYSDDVGRILAFVERHGGADLRNGDSAKLVRYVRALEAERDALKAENATLRASMDEASVALAEAHARACVC